MRIAGPEPTVRRSRLWSAVVAGVIVVAGAIAVTVTTTGSDEDNRPRATAGSTIAQSGAQSGFGSFSVVRQPWGTLLVSTAFVDDTNARRSPEGGRFVRIRLVQSPSPIDRFYLTSAGPSVDRAALPKAEVSVVDGAHTYPVRFTGRHAGYVLSGVDPLLDPSSSATDKGVVAAVALPDRADRILVRVRYDGITQTVDTTAAQTAPVPSTLAELDADLADRLVYGPRFPVTTSLPNGAHATALRVAQQQRTPYLVGRGWAPRGTTWWTAALQVMSTARSSPGRPVYALRDGAVADFHLAGGTVVSDDASLSSGGGPSGLPDVPGPRLAALVSATATSLRLTTPIEFGPADERRRSSVTWTVPVG